MIYKNHFRILFFFVVVLLSFEEVHACTCKLGTAEVKLQNAESVFLGKVTSVKPVGKANGFGEKRIIVTFQVTESFKQAKKEIVLDTIDNKVSCEGYWFKEKQTYLVYAYRFQKRLSTRYCGGALPEDLKSDSRFLKELKTLRKLTENPDKESKDTEGMSNSYANASLGLKH